VDNPSERRETFDSYYGGFLGGQLFRWLDIRKVQITARAVSSTTRRPLQALDLGCGSASISAALRRKVPGLSITAADMDPRLLEIAARKGLKTEVVDFDRPLPFDSEGFDFVFMFDSIEHVRSREAILKEVRRVLRPDGTFVVFTPPYDSVIWVAALRLHGLVTRRDADHMSPFTRESLEWFLRRYFTTVRLGSVNLGLTMWATAQGQLQPPSQPLS